MMPNVMIVTQHDKLKTLLGKLLASTPYNLLDASTNPSQPHRQAKASEPDAVVIGHESQSRAEFFQTINRVRESFPSTPIIAVVENPDIAFVAKTIQTGADTCLLESDLDTATFLAAIDETRNNLLERLDKVTIPSSATSSPEDVLSTEKQAMATIQIDDLVINNQNLSASFQQKMLGLSPTEFEILCYLAHNAGQVVTFEELVYQVYGVQTNRDQARRTLAAHISNLRSKLRDVGAANYLVNRRGRGYLIERKCASISPPENDHLAYYRQALEILTTQLPHIAVCLYDHNGNIIINAGQIITWPTNEPEDQLPTAYSFAERHANFDNQINAVFNQQSSHFEYEDQGGHYTIDLLPVTMMNGDVPMGMILVQDISTFKQLDSLVNGEIKELTSKIMTQMTSEIRTTLITLQKLIVLLRRHRHRISEAEQDTRLNQIHAHIDHLVEYFDAISRLSQTFSNRLP